MTSGVDECVKLCHVLNIDISGLSYLFLDFQSFRLSKNPKNKKTLRTCDSQTSLLFPKFSGGRRGGDFTNLKIHFFLQGHECDWRNASSDGDLVHN